MLDDSLPQADYYQADLDTMQAGSLQRIDAANLNSIVQQIIGKAGDDRHAMVAIGIPEQQSANKLLISITHLLCARLTSIAWKVRPLAAREKELLQLVEKTSD